MAAPVRDAPDVTVPPSSLLDDVLRRVNRLGVLIVDYRQAHGRGFSFDQGLGDFVRDFDARRFPTLLVAK